GIPLHASAVAEHASNISGERIGEHWVQRFHSCHPELKVKWMIGLEKCCAQSLNHTAVTNFYKTTQDAIKPYDIPEENIYEKRIQLGIGARVLALVDCDQKTVQQVEEGNQELATVIECVCADGTAICPSVVFKGLHWDLE
ncbi:hypothetical protein L208DRAFT_1233069, partial [Tricholoma matsutake]